MAKTKNNTAAVGLGRLGGLEGGKARAPGDGWVSDAGLT
jgi:hypothetical protein